MAGRFLINSTSKLLNSNGSSLRVTLSFSTNQALFRSNNAAAAVLTTYRPFTSTSINNAKAEKPRLEPEYFVPRAERVSPTQMFRFDSFFTDRLVRGTRTATTGEINYTPELWTR